MNIKQTWVIKTKQKDRYFVVNVCATVKYGYFFNIETVTNVTVI